MAEGSGGGHDAGRRDFLYIAAGGLGAIGLGAFTWPFINQMNPSQDVLALSTIEVDISLVEEGQAIKVVWRGKPVYIRHRTKAEIDEARAVSMDELPDPQADQDRVQSGREQWLILVGVCTHLGCIPINARGDFGGWFCPCHGSHYDVSGRIRVGPAPENLLVPEYVFLDETKVRIG